MIGQTKLHNELKSYNIDTLPSTILFLGEKGCGKHTLAKELSNKFNLDLIEISNNISLEYIQEIYTKALPAFYLINVDIITERQQNMILKFIEEPIKGSFIILLSSSKASLLNTIINRCVIFTFSPYSKLELEHFIDNKMDIADILNICNTPGQILSTNIKIITDLKSLCKKIIFMLSKANYSNTLSIAQKINFKDEFDKFDINMFFNALSTELLNAYIQTTNEYYIKMYKITLNEKKKLLDSRLNKEMLMEYFLTLLWENAKNEIK